MKIEGYNINLRFVELEDASFILGLRTDGRLGEFLSKTDSDIETQVEWIKKYKDREQNKLEFYFIIESKRGECLGTVRLYDFQEDSFCWGSWIIKPNRPSGTAIESFVLSMGFGFEQLGFERARFDVRKENKKAFELYKFYAGELVAEDELNYYFNYSKRAYMQIKKIMKNMLKRIRKF
jgi:RimJ/RimL family protein N-acetyltransferase